MFFVLHPDNFSLDEAIAPEAQRLGLWWSKNYQRDAQKNKISLEFLALLFQDKRVKKNILRIFLSRKKQKTLITALAPLNPCLPAGRWRFPILIHQPYSLNRIRIHKEFSLIIIIGPSDRKTISSS
ncbi:hypothetical protein [Lutimonas vermicola]|uniref:Uncharacterized protein n=1 Tax=Lutimonas vermicola TaxID=414288 RepID=A0ABU9KXF2_9FLAO